MNDYNENLNYQPVCFRNNTSAVHVKLSISFLCLLLCCSIRHTLNVTRLGDDFQNFMREVLEPVI